jgi:hypothetical protein
MAMGLANLLWPEPFKCKRKGDSEQLLQDFKQYRSKMELFFTAAQAVEAHTGTPAGRSRRGNRDRHQRRGGRWHRALGDPRTTVSARETERRSSKQPGGETRRGASTPTSSGAGRTRGRGSSRRRNSRRRNYQTKKKAM